MIFGAILGSQKRSNLSWNLLENEAPSWIDNFSLLEASGGGFGFDFQERLGSLWGSILDHFGIHFALPIDQKAIPKTS